MSGSEKAFCAESTHYTGSNEATASGSGSKGATVLDAPVHYASSDEAQSSEAAPSPPYKDPSWVIYYPNRWYVEGKHLIYRDAKLLNDKGVMLQTLTIERWVLTWSLHTVPAIHDLFTPNQFDWMSRSKGCYNEEFVREFYFSYVETQGFFGYAV